MHTATSHHTEHGTAADADEPILSHQFDDVEQQSEASTLGMWLFLATEVMFFGGLITAYAVYRSTSPREVALASGHMKVCWTRPGRKFSAGICHSSLSPIA